MTSGRITLRVAAPAFLYWSFIPLLQIASLAIVCRRRPPDISFSRAVELFSRANWPLLLWLVLFAAAWACLPAVTLIPWWSDRRVEYLSAAPALIWSARLDYSFFRHSLKRTPRDAALQLLSQRLLCWIPILAIFVASAGWSELAWRIGL